MSPHAISRRTLFHGIGLAAVAGSITLGGTSTARADHFANYDTVEAYEQTWATGEATVTDNEAGGLAWSRSYVMLSLMRMYQATRDTLYLDRFVDMADQVWQQTDQRRGVENWDGRSGRVWRAGGNYTAGAATIPDASGTPLFELRYAWTRPTEGQVTVSNAADGTFDLHLYHPNAPSRTLTGLSLDPDSPNHVVTRVNKDAYHPNVRWTAAAFETAGVPVEGVYSPEQRYFAFPVHTGMITYPLAMFSRVVIEEGIPRYRGAAQRYYAWTRQSVAFHDDEFEFRTLPDGSIGGDYVWPTGAPVPFDGNIQPYNMTHGLGQTLVELYRIRPLAQYTEKINAMVNSFLHHVEDEGEAWAWRYWPPYSELFNSYPDNGNSEYTPWYGSASQYEDISHAAITVEFLVAAHNAGLDVDRSVVEELARTYLVNVRLDETSVYSRVNGSQPASASVMAQIGRWLPLDQFEPAILEHILDVYEGQHFSPGFGSHLLSMAYTVWARNDGWRND